MSQSERKGDAILGAVLALSGLTHFGAWVILGAIPPQASVVRPPTSVEIIATPPPEPELPAPEPEPEPEPEVVEPDPEPVIPPPRRDRPEPAEPPPPLEEAVPPPAAQEEIADFSGETLTVEGPGPGWTSAVGNGESMEGPIGAPGGQVTGRRRTGTPDGVVGGSPTTPPETVVAVADLRSPPGEPSGVGERLQRLYPTRLRSMSIEGTAMVRIRISANGAISRLRVIRASEPEFGQACLVAVRDAGAWRPAVGPDGQPATTEIRYNCEFSLAY